MIGWTSPSYPTLLGKDAQIPITLDQSAMIAGMLMNGFVVSTPFVECKCLGSKFGVLLGSAIILSGWLLMIGTTNILGLCISRALVGIGAGYGIGKLRIYLKEICDEGEAIILQKSLILFTNFGIVLSYSIGPFVSFRLFSVILAVISGLAFLTFTIVPDTPYNLYRHHKVNSAVNVLKNLHGKECVDDEIENIKYMVENKPNNKTLFQILRNKHTRKSFLIVTFLITIQQFSGGPPLLVYSQVIYIEFGCLYPSACSIVYSVVHLISSGIAIRYVPYLKRKPVLLLSCAICTIISATHACYLYFKQEDIYFTIIPFITMIAYVFFHTTGLAVVSQLVINDIFPINSRNTMNYYWNMYSAQLAVIVTKIFQVLYDIFGMYVSFCMFTSASAIGFFVLLFCLTETKGKLERNRIT